MDSVISWLLLTIAVYYSGIKFIAKILKEKEKRKEESRNYTP